MMKKIIGAVGFAALAVLLLWELNGIFSLKNEDGILQMELFYELETDSVDVMFYGSSHTYSDINPAVLWEEEGIASFDLAGSLQPLWNTYYYIKESLEYQTPEVMVVELVRAIEDRDYIDDERTIVNTFGMRFSKNKIENILVSTQDNFLNYILGYPVYHSRYAELAAEDFEDYGGDPNGEYLKGYYPLFNTKSFDEMPDVSTVTGVGTLSQKTEEYLRKIIALSKEKDIPLLLIVSPYQGIAEDEQEIFNACAVIAEEEGIDFINFNLMYDELDIDPQEDFAEASHLNYKGAEKFSSWLASYLSEEYDLEDHRGDEAYSSWDLNAADWERKKADQLISEEEGWYGLLEILGNLDEDYTFVIALSGDYDNNEQPLKETLMNAGVSEEAAENGGIWISSQGETISLVSGTGETVKIEFKDSDLTAAVSTDGGISLVCDGESQIRVTNGINIYVYDHYTESLVTAVGFDADNGYTLVK